MADAGGGGHPHHVEDFGAALDESARQAADFGRGLRDAAGDLRAIGRGAGDITSAVRGLTSALKALESMGAGGGQGSTAGGKAGAAPSGAPDASAARIAGSIASASAPLQRIEGLLDRMGGTVVVLARRIDGAMKFNAASAAIDRLRKQVTDRFAGMAIDATRAGLKIHNVFARLGDVAGRSLSQLRGMSFAPAASSALRAATGVRAVGTAADTASSAVKGFGRDMLIALGAFGLAFKVVQFFKDGVMGASDLAETTDKLAVVFGSSASTIGKDADRMARDFGTPKKEFMEGAAGIGQIGLAAGKTQAQAAALGSSFAKLGADLASQDNLTFEESLMKLRSGLAGEAEPLRRHGVLLSEAGVKAYAYSKGIAKVGSELTEAQKVEARAGLITQQLARVQGDLARTQGSAANQFRKAGGGLRNFATAVGGLFLPAVKLAVSGFNELLASALDFFESRKEMFSRWAGYVTGAVQTVVDVIRDWPLYWEMAGLKAREVLTNITRWIGVIPDNLALVGSYIANNWRELITDAVNAVGKVFENLGANIGELAVAIWEYMKNPTQGFNFEWKPLLDGFQATAAQLPELIKPQLYSVQAQIDALGAKAAANAKARAESVQAAAAGGAAKPGGKAPEVSERMKELAQDAKQLKDRLKDATPLDEFRHKIEDYRQMLKEGLIDKKEFQKASAGAAGDLVKANDQGRKPYAGALELGSAEARSAVLEHQAGGDRDPMKQIAKAVREQLALQKEQNKTQERLASVLISGKQTQVVFQLPP